MEKNTGHISFYMLFRKVGIVAIGGNIPRKYHIVRIGANIKIRIFVVLSTIWRA